jgi:hypothetical protein
LAAPVMMPYDATRRRHHRTKSDRIVEWSQD